MCEFQSLYFDDDGYIMRCKQCGFYQVAFISTMLTLAEADFQALRKMARQKFYAADPTSSDHSKTFILKTSSHGFYLLLTRNETGRFCDILEGADNEVKALTIMGMFNP